MTTRYCDCDLASGDNDGSSWANAWRTFQQALDGTLAGETCYCKGTDTLSATLDVDTAGMFGTNAAGLTKFIGCNGAGNVDGTRFVIDANGGSYHAVTWAGADMVWWENIEVKNTGAGNYDGLIMSSTAAGCVFINCTFHNCGRYGFNPASYDSYGLCWRCLFYSNGGSGVNYTSTAARYLFCKAYSNTVNGFLSFYAQAIGCVAYDNGDDGFQLYNNGFLFNCIADSNDDDGIVVPSGTALYGAQVIGCRITNHSGSGDIGLNFNSEPAIYGYNVTDNNADNLANNTLAVPIPIEGGSTDSNEHYNENEGEAEGTLQGYTSADDYNLTSTADLRRDAITLPTP